MVRYLATIVPAPSLVNNSRSKDPPRVPSTKWTLWTPPYSGNRWAISERY